MDPVGGVEGVSGQEGGSLSEECKAGMDRKLCWVCHQTACLQCPQSGGNSKQSTSQCAPQHTHVGLVPTHNCLYVSFKKLRYTLVS